MRKWFLALVAMFAMTAPAMAQQGPGGQQQGAYTRGHLVITARGNERFTVRGGGYGGGQGNFGGPCSQFQRLNQALECALAHKLINVVFDGNGRRQYYQGPGWQQQGRGYGPPPVEVVGRGGWECQAGQRPVQLNGGPLRCVAPCPSNMGYDWDGSRNLYICRL